MPDEDATKVEQSKSDTPPAGPSSTPQARLGALWSSLGRSRLAPVALVILVVVLAGGAIWSYGGSSGPASAAPSAVMSPTPWASTEAAVPTDSPTPEPSATPTPLVESTFPIAVVVKIDDNRPSITAQALLTALAAGKVVVPCEVKAVGLAGKNASIGSATPCLPAEQVEAKIYATAGLIGLLPPGLVTASIKVLAIDNADLFGSPSHRTVKYPLMATATMPQAWTAYDSADVRTLISTGDTCPDRGFSLKAVGMKKGWNWTMAGGTISYRGTKPDPYGWGWQVPVFGGIKGSGRVSALISDNDVSANDFECPMVSNWKQHDTGMVFTIDPRVAALLGTKGGLKVVTLGSNHMTDAGQNGVLQTIKYLDAAGIAHTGAGKNLAAALAPAVVDVRGIKFAFVGWDDIKGSAAATSTRAGVAPLTDANVCSSIQAARKVADVVIAMPQWGWPEYHAGITKTQIAQRAYFYKCGADGILGSGTHWASWASILPGTDGPVFAIGSHGNFLFDQAWSRQTMEGVVVEVTFYGKKLVQFRLHPYVVYRGSQPNLLDPTTTGAFVLHQVWSVSDIKLVGDSAAAASPTPATTASPKPAPTVAPTPTSAP